MTVFQAFILVAPIIQVVSSIILAWAWNHIMKQHRQVVKDLGERVVKGDGLVLICNGPNTADKCELYDWAMEHKRAGKNITVFQTIYKGADESFLEVTIKDPSLMTYSKLKWGGAM